MKEPFEFEYTEPDLDWYRIVKVQIKPDDYYYFRLERRYGPSWWLIGKKLIKEPDYEWVETQLGRIGGADLARFIEWAKCERGKGSKITEIKMISGDFNIFNEIKSLL